MSRILVVGINYAPETIGTGKYTSEMCEWLASRGHDVRVITAPPYYPEWEVKGDYKRCHYHREQLNGVEVMRCPIWVPRKPSAATRVLHLASFGLTSAGALVQWWHWKPDWVINIAPTLSSSLGAVLMARMSGGRSWLHIQDFEVEAAMNMGIVRPGPLRSLGLMIERWLLNRFDIVSSISPRMLLRLTQKGVPDERQFYFPNWVDTDEITPLMEPSKYRAELGIPAAAVVAMYSGNMGLKQGLELLGDSARVFREDDNIYFVFGGEGPARLKLQNACRGLRNVRFLGLQKTEDLQQWLGLADIHLLPQRADVADLVMPSKLTGMFASGRPIVATAHLGTGVSDAVQGRGLVTCPGDTDAFVAGVRRLATDHSLRKRLGQAAREHAVATLGRNTVLRRIESRLNC